jgi:hypothetical protein
VITGLNLFGYFIAFLAVCYYNYLKLQSMKASAASVTPVSGSSADLERMPLKTAEERAQ